MILHSSSFSLFHSGQVFHEFVCPLTVFFLRFSSISLHCSPIQFSFAFFMHLLMLFTSLYFSEPSGSIFFFCLFHLCHCGRVHKCLVSFYKHRCLLSHSGLLAKQECPSSLSDQWHSVAGHRILLFCCHRSLMLGCMLVLLWCWKDVNLVLFCCWCWCRSVEEWRKGQQNKKNGLELNQL